MSSSIHMFVGHLLHTYLENLDMIFFNWSYLYQMKYTSINFKLLFCWDSVTCMHEKRIPYKQREPAEITIKVFSNKILKKWFRRFFFVWSTDTSYDNRGNYKGNLLKDWHD